MSDKGFTWGGITVNRGDSFTIADGKDVFIVTDTDFSDWDWDADCLIIEDKDGNKTVMDVAFFMANFKGISR